MEVRDREKWIRQNAPGTDVIISHPQLVSTGLDFFDEGMHYNYATIIFYQMDYQVNLIRQAGHRHWRIGQDEECRTYYLYYDGTLQAKQVALVGSKFSAAKNLEGKFSEEGLAALSDGGLEAMALAKALDKKIADRHGFWGATASMLT